MSVEMFFRMEGVEGGTLNYSHKGWADCLSYQWDLAPRAGDALGEGVNQLSLVKTVGPDSAVLMTLCTAATIVRVAELSIIPNLGKRDVPQKYLALTLEDVQVMRISTGGGLEESVFRETITLRFGKVRYEYHQYSDIGAAGAPRPLATYTFDWAMPAGSIA